ncbi:AAA family ATPase [Streptomyces sp. PSKA30]|uniref:AAA family ATPase n=1 Tax=Streptomyces sp. PSKA30 TaxID=2874597 RepID=UPI001CD06E07|nr:AAA family ATPase [Streptomyces sp. PSKA30]MBZ9645290.1 AAA family ATPase [Streptomyces sp. PSKA30]
MPIRDCRVIAIEGTQAAGKTTLVHALTAHLREQSIGVTCTREPARTSPFMEDIVLHDEGNFDLVAELDLFAQHLTVPPRAARHHQVLITDKTPANVLALAGLVLDPTEPGTAAVLAAAEAMCRAWMPLAYDAIVYCRDRYDQKAGGDRMRDKVLSLQHDADTAIYEACRAMGVPMLEVPMSLTVSERVQWTVERVGSRGLIAVRSRLESPTGKAPHRSEDEAQCPRSP